MAHQKGQGHLHDVIFSIPGARRSREMSRISRFRCRRVTLSLQALIIRRPFAESSEAMNPRHRMNANRCRRRVITLNARIAAHQQIEYIKRFDRVECRPPGSPLSRGVGTLGLLAAQCLMSTSITCAVANAVAIQSAVRSDGERRKKMSAGVRGVSWGQGRYSSAAGAAVLG